MTETKSTCDSCSSCDNVCSEHNVTAMRVELLEEQLTIVNENTSSVDKLATRVNLLMSLLGILVAVTTGAASYTFTALSDFKTLYNIEQRNTQKQLYSMEQIIDKRLDAIDNRLTRIEAHEETK